MNPVNREWDKEQKSKYRVLQKEGIKYSVYFQKPELNLGEQMQH